MSTTDDLDLTSSLELIWAARKTASAVPGELWYHALEIMKVPVELVVYTGEGHLFNKPADNRDYTFRTLQWFDRWFSGNGTR